VIRQSSISVTTELTRICQGRIHVQELRHSLLGVLTSVMLILIWGGFGDYASFKPGRQKMIRTNIMAVIDPIARLAKHVTSATIKQSFIWKPHTEGKLFPWTRPHGQIWVETWSVFDKDQLSTCELTFKEAGQLLDLRPEWSQDIAEIVWNWNNSAPPHIRLLAEVGISGAQWIQDYVPSLHYACRDLSRERVPWMSTLKIVKDPLEQDERLLFLAGYGNQGKRQMYMWLPKQTRLKLIYHFGQSEEWILKWSNIEISYEPFSCVVGYDTFIWKPCIG
jgi:hypothetical protein